MKFYLVVILLAFAACDKSLDDDSNLKGTWNSIGYGRQLNFDNGNVAVYDTSENGCALNSVFPTSLFEDYYEIINLTETDLEVQSGFTKYKFTRADSATALCDESTIVNSALSNFNALWHTFNENYVSFDLREINWEQMKQTYRPLLSEQSSDLELFTVLNEMVSELNDGHASIEIPESLEDIVDDDDDDVLKGLVITEINSKYVENLKTYNKGVINWGTINGNIGYIQINDFENLANYQIDNTLSAEEFWETYEENAEESDNYAQDVFDSFKTQMALIFNDIKNTESCIIDIRFNGGGFDEIGLEVLSYFIDDTTHVFSKKARHGNGFTEVPPIYIDPNSNQYTGDVFILTSHQTASASETFVLATLNLPNSKRIGSNTEGIFSDILSKRLPNGWEYGLSNEIYESVGGTNYERYGIPPEYLLDYSLNTSEFYTNLLEELNVGDKAIEKAIELADF